MTDSLRRPRPTSWIAQERVLAGPAPLRFWLLASVLTVAAFAGLWALAGGSHGVVAAERAPHGQGAMGALLATLTPLAGRTMAALGGALAVGATAVAGLRLFHSEWVGLLAGLLVLLDPGLLVHGHLATPVAPLLGLLMGALACFVWPRATVHWIGSLLLTVAAVVHPASLFWSLPLAALVLLRGHIYAAPKHLAETGLQVLLFPAAGAAIGAWAGGLSGCFAPDRLDAVVLRTVVAPGQSVVAVHNPAIWFAGLGALLFLAFAGLVMMAARFRIQRLPGRIQFRLPGPLPRTAARFLWLLGLALFVPHPVVWLPLLALALAGGVRDLGEDSRGFGLVVAALVVLFAVLYTARLWALVVGTGSPAEAAEMAQVLPWTRVVGC